MKIPYLAIFRLELQKTIARLDFSTFNLSKCNTSSKKKNFFKCRTKIVLFGYFWLELEKATLLYFFTSLKFFQTKFRPNIRILKFGTKIVLIGYFGLEFQKVSNLKSVSSISNLLTSKVSSKNKDFLNLRLKIP